MIFSSINEIRDHFLSETLKYVSRNQGYYPPHLKLAKTRTVFSEFPPIEKKVIALNQNCFLFPRQDDFITNVTGATTGTPIVIFKSLKELEFTKSFYKTIFDFQSSQNTLIIDNGHHGKYQSPINSNAYYFPLKNISHAELIVSIINNGLFTPRGKISFEILTLSALNAKIFISYLLENNIKLRQDIKIVTSSSYFSSKWKNLLIKEFGIETTQEYGISEFSQGNAWFCSKCKSYHFPPTIYPELDQNQVGELLISTLYPFAQVMIFLRYRSGDIFRKMDFCEVYGDYGYKLLGRKNYSTNFDTNKGILTSLMVAEFLEQKEWAVFSNYLDTNTILKNNNATFAKFRFENNNHICRIIIETKSKTVDKKLIKKELLNVAHNLSGIEPTFDLEIKLVNPNSLEDNYFKY